MSDDSSERSRQRKPDAPIPTKQEARDAIERVRFFDDVILRDVKKTLGLTSQFQVFVWIGDLPK